MCATGSTSKTTAPALVAALFKGKPGAVYNFGGDGEMVNLEVVRLILDRLGKPHSLISFVTDRLGHDRRYAIDSSFAKRELNWHPLHTAREGIAATVDWYLEQPRLVGDPARAHRTLRLARRPAVKRAQGALYHLLCRGDRRDAIKFWMSRLSNGTKRPVRDERKGVARCELATAPHTAFRARLQSNPSTAAPTSLLCFGWANSSPKSAPARDGIASRSAPSTGLLFHRTVPADLRA